MIDAPKVEYMRKRGHLSRATFLEVAGDLDGLSLETKDRLSEEDGLFLGVELPRSKHFLPDDTSSFEEFMSLME